MPLSDVDQRFVRDPLAFMKSVSVQPQDYKNRGAGAATLYDATPHSYNTTGPKAAYDSMLSVQGSDNRVAYTKLTERLNSGMKNHFDLFFYSSGVARTTSVDNYIACYFLPWSSDHLTKIQIPPKVPARADVDVAKQRASDPDIFFTAAINGCSVFVEGDPRHPTVYHAGTTESRSNVNNPQAFAGGNSRLHWTDVFNTHRTGAGQFGAIHKGDYVNTSGTGTTAEAVQ